MSSAGTRALFRRTKKYNRLFALFITSLTWLFHLRLHEIVTPRILADSTVSNTLPSTKRGVKWCFCLLQSMTITLHLSALSCTFCALDQFSTTLTAVWVSPNALRGTISATVVSSIGNLSTRHFSGDGDPFETCLKSLKKNL